MQFNLKRDSCAKSMHKIFNLSRAYCPAHNFLDPRSISKTWLFVHLPKEKLFSSKLIFQRPFPDCPILPYHPNPILPWLLPSPKIPSSYSSFPSTLFFLNFALSKPQSATDIRRVFSCQNIILLGRTQAFYFW